MKTNEVIVYSDWLLRMECGSFIMIVNKNTHEYRNLYRHMYENPNQIKEIALLLNRHEKYK